VAKALLVRRNELDFNKMAEYSLRNGNQAPASVWDISLKHLASRLIKLLKSYFKYEHQIYPARYFIRAKGKTYGEVESNLKYSR